MNWVIICGFLLVAISGVVCQDKIHINLDVDNNIEGSQSEEAKSLQATSTTQRPSTTPNPLVCPGKDAPWQLLPLPCATDKDCRIFGKSILCCDKRCLQGVPPPTPSPTHSPTLFGFIQQNCPIEPVAEIWEIKECITDSDCAPRICCPEQLKSGENVSYCRTAEPIWEKIPAPKQLLNPIRGFVGYMQCTPPPPPLLDLFPKSCQSPLDCFPNLCCQEGGKRFCRPPKRSILTLIADIGQRIIPTDAAREFIKRIS